jgi:hypothetical protein
MQADSQPPENPVADALRNALQRQRTAYLAHPVPSLAELSRMRSPQIEPGAVETHGAWKRRRPVA